ncbi:MAG: hypothetical protein GX962_09365 [Epulopiscium sp.]|nr:hypothetical protein [Candidatus Epulonipiscium sp.]
MKILEWNVNCAVGSGNGRKELSSLFPDKPDYDILVLTEFYRLDDYGEFEEIIKNWGYEVFITDEQKNRNDIFIAVSKEYEPKLEKNQVAREGMPDFLAIPLKSGHKDFVIVGVRFFGDYEDKYSQFIKFLHHINCYENIIIAGDFNNAKIRGDENTIYTERQIDRLYSYHEEGIMKKYQQFEYNYHRIKLWFAQNEISLVTPIEGVSFPYKSSYPTGSKIDHFATKSILISNVEYLPTELSDHYQLVGEITV